MVEQVYSSPDIYRVHVNLPENPLKYLNCYVIRTAEENLIIDTGFNRPECLEAFWAGIHELNLDMSRTSFFFTHLHADHTGLVNHVTTEDTRIYMSRIDYDYLEDNLAGDNWTWMENKFIREGMSEELIIQQRLTSPARRYTPEHMFKAVKLEDNDVLTVGGYTFRCILTPGHTPGHMCLYMPAEKILFSADHVLFDITPNITMWRGIPDSLGDYLDSLEKVKQLDIKLTLPGHRENHMDVYERISQIEAHHDFRLSQTLEIIKNEPGLDAYTIGSRLSWSMRGKNWEEFPIAQKWFAVGETLSHLDYLMERNKIVCHDGGARISYTVKEEV